MSKTKYYIAYGSNLNVEQMKRRCPTARILGSSTLQDYQLIFSRVASILPKTGSCVPVGIWEIDYQSEKALDRYEGFPWLYRKEVLKVMIEGKTVSGMVYIMNQVEPSPPSPSYYKTIEQGYRNFHLDLLPLEKALEESLQNRIHQEPQA